MWGVMENGYQGPPSLSGLDVWTNDDSFSKVPTYCGDASFLAGAGSQTSCSATLGLGCSLQNPSGCQA